MAGIRNRIADILLKSGVIDELQLRSALARHDQWGGRLTRIASDMGLATEDQITEAIARALNVPRTRLGTVVKDPTALAKVDPHLAQERSVFPISLRDQGKTLLLAMADPTDLQCIDQIAAKARTRVQVMVAGDGEIQSAIERHYHGREPAQPRAQMSGHQQGVDPMMRGYDDEEEGKVVDAAGKTLFKNIRDILGEGGLPPINKDSNAPGFSAPPVAREPLPPPVSASPSPSQSTKDLLDEILGAAPKEVFTPEELARIQALKDNQQKSTRILRAVLELCVEKGYLKQAELAARMK